MYILSIYTNIINYNNIFYITTIYNTLLFNKRYSASGSISLIILYKIGTYEQYTKSVFLMVFVFTGKIHLYNRCEKPISAR